MATSVLGSLKRGDLRLELVIVMPQSFARGRLSRDREQVAFDRDVIEFIAHSSSLSCRQASERSGLRVTASILCWRLPPEVRRSQCPR